MTVVEQSQPRGLSILLVEDNHDIANQIIEFLTDAGMLVDYAHSGKTALALMETQAFELVILDLMLPDIDGYCLCKLLKEKSQHHLPVLMLTARDSLGDKLQGFEMGADDYLTKPFALEEVYMRCLALGRRVLLHQEKVLKIGDLEVDFGQKLAKRQQRNLALSQTDFAILSELALAFPNAVSKRELVRKIWGDEAPETDALRSHIYTLRRAVDRPFEVPMIKTVHGIGLKLTENGGN